MVPFTCLRRYCRSPEEEATSQFVSCTVSVRDSTSVCWYIGGRVHIWFASSTFVDLGSQDRDYMNQYYRAAPSVTTRCLSSGCSWVISMTTMPCSFPLRSSSVEVSEVIHTANDTLTEAEDVWLAFSDDLCQQVCRHRSRLRQLMLVQCLHNN